jgi:hypothetical protein
MRFLPNKTKVFLLISFVYTSCFAQEATFKKFGFGFETGFSLAKLDPFGPYLPGAELASFNSVVKFSPTIGVQGLYRFNPMFGLLVGLNYIGHGGSFAKKVGEYQNYTNTGNIRYNYSYGYSTSSNNSTTSIYARDRYRMSFFELSICPKLLFLPKSIASPFILAGFSIGKLLTSVNNYDFQIGAGSSGTEDITEHVSPFTINYVLGAGLDFLPDRELSFGVNVKLHNSLTRVFKYDIQEYDDGDTIYSYDLVTHYHTFLFTAFLVRHF